MSVVPYAAEQIRFSVLLVIGVVSALDKGKKTVDPGRVIFEQHLKQSGPSRFEDLKKSLGFLIHNSFWCWSNSQKSLQIY